MILNGSNKFKELVMVMSLSNVNSCIVRAGQRLLIVGAAAAIASAGGAHAQSFETVTPEEPSGSIQEHKASQNLMLMKMTMI